LYFKVTAEFPFIKIFLQANHELLCALVKILFLGLSILSMRIVYALAACMLIVSCSKKDSESGDKINPADAVAVSKAIGVWHGSRVAGTPPPPSSNPYAPLLDPQSNNQVIKSISGRYAVLNPEVLSGDVAGYYVSVTGAQEYFKVDYSRPRTGGRQTSASKASFMKKIGNAYQSRDGAADSAIVITIPTSIQPGQFCISYCAYDSTGNVSNIIVSCITVSSFGGDASVNYLAGLWKITDYQDAQTGTWEPNLTSDTTSLDYYCVNNVLQSWCPTTNCTPVSIPKWITTVTKDDFTFGSNGGLQYESAAIEKTLNETSSTCSNYVYDAYTYAELMQGAWSYNTTTSKLTIIFEFDDQGTTETEAYEFTLNKISNTKIELLDPLVGGVRLQK
jgi:hypothetical protein